MSIHHATHGPRPVQLRLKPELHEWLRQQAATQDRSANWIINALVAQARMEDLNTRIEQGVFGAEKVEAPNRANG